MQLHRCKQDLELALFSNLTNASVGHNRQMVKCWRQVRSVTKTLALDVNGDPRDAGYYIGEIIIMVVAAISAEKIGTKLLQNGNIGNAVIRCNSVLMLKHLWHDQLEAVLQKSHDVEPLI